MSNTETAVGVEGGIAGSPANTRKPHRQVRVHTIVWGAILVGLSVLGLGLGRVGAPFSGTAVLWSVVAFGGLLILAAVLTAIIRLARR